MVKTENPSPSKTMVHSPKIKSSTAALSTQMDEDLEAISVSDIFSRRLRTLKKRLVKIEKNEELLAQKSIQSARPFKSSLSKPDMKHPQSVDHDSPILNPDQLNAIKMKEALLEIIKEVEHLNTQVVEWETVHPSVTKSFSQMKKESNTKNEHFSKSFPLTVTESVQRAYKDVLSLWIALNRLDAVSPSLLSPEDFQALRTLYWILHSVIISPSVDVGLADITLWMNGTHVEDASSAIQLLPPFVRIQHCVSKILSSPVDHDQLPSSLSFTQYRLERLDIKGKEGSLVPETGKPESSSIQDNRSLPQAKLSSPQSNSVPQTAKSIAKEPEQLFVFSNPSHVDTPNVSYHLFPSVSSGYTGFLPPPGMFSSGNSGPVIGSLGVPYGTNMIDVSRTGQLTFTPAVDSLGKQRPEHPFLNERINAVQPIVSPHMSSFKYSQIVPVTVNNPLVDASVSSSSNSSSSKQTSLPCPSDSAIVRAGRITNAPNAESTLRSSPATREPDDRDVGGPKPMKGPIKTEENKETGLPMPPTAQPPTRSFSRRGRGRGHYSAPTSYRSFGKSGYATTSVKGSSQPYNQASSIERQPTNERIDHPRSFATSKRTPLGSTPPPIKTFNRPALNRRSGPPPGPLKSKLEATP